MLYCLSHQRPSLIASELDDFLWLPSAASCRCDALSTYCIRPWGGSLGPSDLTLPCPQGASCLVYVCVCVGGGHGCRPWTSDYGWGLKSFQMMRMLRGWTEYTASGRGQPGKQNSLWIFKHGIYYKELVIQRMEELRSPGGDDEVTRNPLWALAWKKAV